MNSETKKNNIVQDFKEITEIHEKDTYFALLNILEDVEESRIRAVEEKNKTLAVITNFADGLLVFDKENKLYLINPVAEKFLSVDAEELINKKSYSLEKFPWFEEIKKFLKDPTKKIFRKEIKINKELILELSAVSITREGESLGSLIVLHNITREKLIEQMKTEFVSLAAHQLRTPLSAIKWTLKMILDGDLGEITKEQKDFLEKSYISNERMINLINDLLNVTRIEEGRYLYNLEFVQFEDLVEEIIKNYKNETERKNIKIQFEKPKNKTLAIKLDAEKIKLTVSNLIDNAIKYTLPGGKIEVFIKSDKEKITFIAKDSGIGIPKDQQKRLFSKFFRGANALRIETDGSGLGLFIAKNIVEAHEGKIWFESEEDKGSTFYFELPLKAKNIK